MGWVGDGIQRFLNCKKKAKHSVICDGNKRKVYSLSKYLDATQSQGLCDQG